MKLAIVAGEASGDLHASEVVRELKRLDPALETFGIGGDLLAAEGMRILHHAREMGIVGFFNVLRNLRMFRRIFDDVVQAIAAERPDAVLLVDYPGFNLRLAKRCRELGLRVIYYISPQVWAWRRGRVKHIAKYVDRMLVILPFEEDFYRQHGVPVTHVGHPLIDELAGIARGDRPPGTPLKIALLPGSRRGEVSALLPAMLDAVGVLGGSRHPERSEGSPPQRSFADSAAQDDVVDAYVIQAPTIAARELVELMARCGRFVRIVPHDGGQAIADADVALSSSGTATLECAVIGTPVVVMYKLTAITHLLAKRLVKLPHFGLINIIAGAEIVPELIQKDVNGERIAAEVRRMAEPGEHARLRAALADVRRRLGGHGASRRAAEAIMAAVRA